VVISRCLEVLRDLNLVQLDGDQVTCPKVTSEAYANLQELGGIIAPTLERYYIINELLAQSAHLSLREVESNAALIGQQLSIFYGMNTPEFFDKSLFSTLVATLKSQDIIQTEQQAVTLAPSFKTYKLAVQATLGDELKINVQQLVHRHLATSAPAALLL
jgi:glycerol-3-phosphate O-acyltransferase